MQDIQDQQLYILFKSLINNPSQNLKETTMYTSPAEILNTTARRESLAQITQKMAKSAQITYSRATRRDGRQRARRGKKGCRRRENHVNPRKINILLGRMQNVIPGAKSSASRTIAFKWEGAAAGVFALVRTRESARSRRKPSDVAAEGSEARLLSQPGGALPSLKAPGRREDGRVDGLRWEALEVVILQGITAAGIH